MLVLDEDVLPFQPLHELQIDDIDGNINAVMMNLLESDMKKKRKKENKHMKTFD